MESLVQRLQESVTVRRVFGEPHSQDGVTVVAVVLLLVRWRVARLEAHTR